MAYDKNLHEIACINRDNSLRRSKTIKEFSLTVRGSIHGNKHGDVINDSIRALKQAIIKKRDDTKVLKTVNIKIFIHDNATMIDYNVALPIIDKIAMGIREFVGSGCHVNFMSSHKKSVDTKFCFECNIVEGPY